MKKHITEKLELTDAQLRLIVDSLADGIITMDDKSIIRSFNPAAELIFGYRTAEVIGEKVTMLMPESSRDQHDQFVAEFLASGEHNIIGIPRELEAQRKDGERFPISLAVGWVFFDNHPLFTAIVRDVTEAKSAEEALQKSEQRLKEAQRIGRMGDWSLDIATGGLHWSDEIYRIFGRHPGEFEPSYERFFDMVHTDDAPSVKRSEQLAFSKSGKQSIDHRIVLPHGDIRWVHEEAEVIFDQNGVPRYLAGTVQDITRQKRSEILMLEAKEEAERANQAKSEFLSRMSHELRTPMNAILGFTQVLEMKEGLTPDTLEHVEEIHNAGKHLLKIINDLLDLARIESGMIQLNMEGVHVASVLEECLAIMRSMAASRGIEVSEQLDTCKDTIVYADGTLLKQVLLNLLSNAVKYNRDNGQVKVACKNQNNDRVRISISDTGLGIPEEKYTDLFEPFSRLGAEHTNVEGTGIGLAICKNMVEIMGGEIGLHSELNQGSTFWIDLKSGSDMEQDMY